MSESSREPRDADPFARPQGEQAGTSGDGTGYPPPTAYPGSSSQPTDQPADRPSDTSGYDASGYGGQGYGGQGYGGQGYGQTGSEQQYGQPGYAEPGYGQSGSGQQSGYGQQYGQTGYGQPAYGQSGGYPAQSGPGSPAPGYGPPPGYGGYGAAAPTNSLAIVSLVLSLLGFIIGFTAIGGVICGHIARRQIRERGEQGDGLALAGLIIGYILIGLGVAFVVFFIVLIAVAGVGSTI
ncbi:DUF4190 domain-containing protein [Actinomycetospora atypica]|uniref:DUF4190 domain-containing protein n=1 Tax=Actinomycetospora atypica TaxID=1290095 RepID=A0ABV9YK39_9PSEU